MIMEYDVIRAKEQLTDKVYKGCKGAVLMVFEGDTIAYEVEFVDEEGESLEVITVRDKDIEKI